MSGINAQFQPNYDRLPDDDLERIIEGLRDKHDMDPWEAEAQYLKMIGDAGDIGEECLALALEVRERRMAERLYGMGGDSYEVRTQ